MENICIHPTVDSWHLILVSNRRVSELSVNSTVFLSQSSDNQFLHFHKTDSNISRRLAQFQFLLQQKKSRKNSRFSFWLKFSQCILKWIIKFMGYISSAERLSSKKWLKKHEIFLKASSSEQLFALYCHGFYYQKIVEEFFFLNSRVNIF